MINFYPKIPSQIQAHLPHICKNFDRQLFQFGCSLSALCPKNHPYLTFHFVRFGAHRDLLPAFCAKCSLKNPQKVCEVKLNKVGLNSQDGKESLSLKNGLQTYLFCSKCLKIQNVYSSFNGNFNITKLESQLRKFPISF